MVTIILISIFVGLLVGFLLIIQFPDTLPYFRVALDAIVFYLGKAMDIVWIFIPSGPAIAFMSLAIAVEVIVLGYKFVMWILRKVPTASIN